MSDSTLPAGATGSGRDIHLPPRGPPLKDKYSITIVPHPTKDNPNVFNIAPDFGDGDSKRWPEQDQDMTLLQPENDKHVLWRRTAGDWLAKDMNLFDEHEAAHWILGNLPEQYGLFEQITHPKDNKAAPVVSTKNSKLRLDRFIFGHNGRKIRSALSLGKHISWLLHGSIGTCTCDGCKVVSKSSNNGTANASASAAATNGASPASATTSSSATPATTTTTAANGKAASPSPLTTAATKAKSSNTSTAKTTNGATKPKKKRTVNVAASDSETERRSNASGSSNVNGSSASSTGPATKKTKGKSRAYDEDDDSMMDEDEGSENSYRPTVTTARQVTTATGRKGSVSSNGHSKQPHAPAVPVKVRRPSVPVVPQTDLEARADQFAQDMKAADPTRANVIHSPWLAHKTEDIDHPSWCRIGELVWAKTHQDLAKLEMMRASEDSRSKPTPRFSHWPAIIRGRTTRFNKNSTLPPQVEYRVEFLALLDQPERIFEAHEVVPWLGYIAAGLTAQEMQEAIRLGGTEVAHSRQWTRDLVSNGIHATRAAFLSAYMTGQFFASIQTRSLPTIEAGSHLLPDPEKAGNSPISLKLMYMARPTTRYLSHEFVFYGPELIHVGDVVRLSSNVELPSSVKNQVIDASPLQMPTSLVLHVTKFVRGGRDCPLLVRGKIYEMNEITIAADDGIPADYVSDDDIFETSSNSSAKDLGDVSALILNGRQMEWAKMNGLDLESSSEEEEDEDDEEDNGEVPAKRTRNGRRTTRASKKAKSLPHLRKKMPAPPFPAHRWRCLTPGREVDLLMTDLAGRYYPVSPMIYHDDTLVNKIAETASKTGVVGQVGIAPLALLLGGLMSGDKVPRVNAPNGLVGDDRERQLAIAEEQAFITAGLRAAVKFAPTYVHENVGMDRPQTAVMA